ncbi:hypothetical protein GCM10023200_50980 [Actinomycetospora chlora]|uniref:Uncharacterized protein n=1 Tax=Actinomycetospora chlora TaxID=663608 RepID=A0ABP9C9S6_9PSEU
MSDDREPDIEFRSRVRARRLRFHDDPEVRIDATVSGSRRVNLPDRVRRDVTYRDVQVDEVILARLED